MLGLRRVGIAVLVVVGCLSSPVGSVGPVSAAPRMWRHLASPTVAGAATFLFDVSCVRTDWCIAVGQAQYPPPDERGTHAVIEQWDGSTWSMVTPASDRTWSGLQGVACLAADDCLAVGWQSTPPPEASAGTLVEHWDGSTWAVVPSPNQDADGDTLKDVACATPTTCFAVGSGYPPHSGEQTAVLEQWDGASWTVVPSLLPDVSSQLLGIACPSTTFCVAVGNKMLGVGTTTLTEVWNGASWSIVKSRNRTMSGKHANNRLNGVACPSPTDCTAVGAVDAGKTSTTLAERWDGTKWRLATTPTVADGAAFSGVNCVGTYCAAVGYSGDGQNGSSTLVESTRGHRFEVVPSASPGPGYNFLSGVACTDVGACVAVGDFYRNTPVTRTLIVSP